MTLSDVHVLRCLVKIHVEGGQWKGGSTQMIHQSHRVEGNIRYGGRKYKKPTAQHLNMYKCLLCLLCCKNLPATACYIRLAKYNVLITINAYT